MTRARKHRKHGTDMRAAALLAVDATERVTTVVEKMHVTIASGPAVLGTPLAMPARLITGAVYGGIRAVTRLVGAGVDLALAQLEPVLGASAPGPEREALIAAVNGVIGDYLDETGNPFAIEMHLRHDGHALDLEHDELGALGDRLLVLVHGSSMCVSQWNRRGHDHGAALAAERGYTPVYVQYNSGRHISTNGLELAALLEALVTRMPVPPREVVIVAHSMGGMVSRSACHAAEHAGYTWRRLLTRLVCLGTPHHGAPLERGGNLIDQLLVVSRYSAPLASLGKLRSAGVTDLRYGYVLDAHWRGRDRFAPGHDDRTPLALPDGVACYAIAGTLARQPGGKLPGDGLVPVASALGHHRRPELELGFPAAHQWIAFGTGHLDLVGSKKVYAQLAEWL